MFINDMSTINRYSNIFINRSLANKNITSAEHYVLMFLFGKEEVTQDEIAQYFALDKGSISKTLYSLEMKGYVKRIENPEDRREKKVTLTELGITSFKSTHELLEKWHEEIMFNISKEELAIFNKVINQMAKNAVTAIKNLE